MKIAVIGAGSWGTALANQLAGNGHNVSLWARRTEVVTSINKEHRNPRYLSDVRLHDDVVATLSHRDAVLRARAAVIVTPSNLCAAWHVRLQIASIPTFRSSFARRASRKAAAFFPTRSLKPRWETATASPCCLAPTMPKK